MNLDALTDLLKRRDCDEVCYFHTDHFEPWSITIDDASARAVERMARQARNSRHARKLSLFYSVFVPYRLVGDGPCSQGDERAEDDDVVFTARHPHQEGLARDVIGPLVNADDHEMHLHVHHEFWTRNHSHFDHPVARWVNAHSKPAADLQRLDLHFRLCKAAIAREISAPLERWAFIHGNWALNGSDPLICQIASELACIMRHGGYGDFSFPAGRGYCDPKLKSPFTCLPLDRVRVYDDARADPRAVAAGTDVMQPDRFFIWSSEAKSIRCSLDYYSATNRKLLAEPEQMVAHWLAKSVVLGRTLFIKTHAHSMKPEYRLSEPGSVIPHCHPDVVRVFDGLERACERARIGLQYRTVNEVMNTLAALDGGAQGVARLGISSTRPAKIAPTAASVVPAAEPAMPPATPEDVAAELLAMHREWLAIQGGSTPPDDLYRLKVTNAAPLEAYEIALAKAVVAHHVPDTTRIIEIGSGWGGLAILLARLGYEVVGFEGSAARYAACRWHIEQQIRRFPALRSRLLLPRDGLFPEAFAAGALAQHKLNIGIATNITHSYTAQHQGEIAEAALAFDEFIIDLARFGVARDGRSERTALLNSLTVAGFVAIECVVDQEPYEYWRLGGRRHWQPI